MFIVSHYIYIYMFFIIIFYLLISNNLQGIYLNIMCLSSEKEYDKCVSHTWQKE